MPDAIDPKDFRPKIIVESPFRAGQGFTQTENIDFAYKVCTLALSKGYNPFASHLLYTQFMDDASQTTRNLGIRLGLEWGYHASEVWFCLRTHERMTDGMVRALEFYRLTNIKIRHMAFLPNGQFIQERADDDQG